MLEDNNHPNFGGRILEATCTTSIYFGLFFINNSFYYPNHLAAHTIISVFLITYGLLLVNKWIAGCINRVKWFLVVTILTIFPLQIYSFLINKSSIGSNTSFIIALQNIIADVIVIIVLTYKMKGMKNEHGKQYKNK